MRKSYGIEYNIFAFQIFLGNFQHGGIAAGFHSGLVFFLDLDQLCVDLILSAKDIIDLKQLFFCQTAQNKIVFGNLPDFLLDSFVNASEYTAAQSVGGSVEAGVVGGVVSTVVGCVVEFFLFCIRQNKGERLL